MERLAREENVPLVDLRGAFLDHWHLDTLLCEDGTHPNSAGQALIGRAFRDFAERWEAALQDALKENKHQKGACPIGHALFRKVGGSPVPMGLWRPGPES